MTLPTPPPAPPMKSWGVPLLALALAILVQFGGIVWFAKGLQSSTDDLARRLVLLEIVNPAVSQAATEKRLLILEAEAHDYRAALGAISDKIGMTNEKLARVEGILGVLMERAQRPGVPAR